jgi:hypothetical protein
MVKKNTKKEETKKKGSTGEQERGNRDRGSGKGREIFLGQYKDSNFRPIAMSDTP